MQEHAKELQRVEMTRRMIQEPVSDNCNGYQQLKEMQREDEECC